MVKVKIYFSWIPTCAAVFQNKSELWQDLVGPNDTDSTELVQEFYSCVAALMSIQLRSMVINSLNDFLQFFETHKVSSDFFSNLLTLFLKAPFIIVADNILKTAQRK